MSSPGSSSVGAPAAATPQKRRKVSQKIVDSGVDHLLDNTEDKDRVYINKMLDEKHHSVTSFLAGMLRDGEVEKALERKQQTQVMHLLGPKMPDRLQGFLLKHFTRRYCRELVDLFIGSNLFPPGEKSVELCDDETYLGLVMYAIHGIGNMPVPIDHACSGYEEPMKLVHMQRYNQVSQGAPRLEGLTPDTTNDYVHYKRDPEDVTMVNLTLRPDCRIELPWTCQTIQKYSDWKLEEAYCYSSASIRSRAGGMNQCCSRSSTQTSSSSSTTRRSSSSLARVTS